jgi:hypothetical protein
MSPRIAFKTKNILMICVFTLITACSSSVLPDRPSTPISLLPSQTPTVEPGLTPMSTSIWLDPELPQNFLNQFPLISGLSRVENIGNSQVQITFSKTKSDFDWVYALVAPFPTVMDGISDSDLQNAWKGNFNESAIKKPILLSAETKAILSHILGEPSEKAVSVMNEEQLLQKAWDSMPAWAIIPFEQINPKWKVLDIDGHSPLRRDFDQDNYPLTVFFGIVGDSTFVQNARQILDQSPVNVLRTNRDDAYLTIVMLTGTTALTRDTGQKMDAKGILYPAQDIKGWFEQADIIHISNEVSFKQGCDLKDRGRFCSKPEYLGLLQSIGTNVIELTGNHLMDYGKETMDYSLSLYKEANLSYYGGGANLEDARKPLLIENHGNKIAFLGCNYGFPESDIATADSPGANPCNPIWMKAAIQDLDTKGYDVIFTFQHTESCTLEPQPNQRGDFYRAAEAGATIISGSQAHCPQGMEFHKDAFIHYGLGNLFFDQTDILQRREMLDLHYFYNGKYIGSEFLTAMLEDRAKPRPMTPTERIDLMTQVFESSGWLK